MRIKLIIILVVMLIFLSVFAVKKYIDNSIVDKDGMIRESQHISEIHSNSFSDKE